MAAPLFNPIFSGSTLAASPPLGDRSMAVATTEWVAETIGGTGSGVWPLQWITAGTTLAANSLGTMHICSATAGDYTITLPPAAGSEGGVVGFVMVSGLDAIVTIAPASSETIDGASSRLMWAGESASLISDGKNWYKIAGKTVPMSCRMYRTTAQSIPSGAWTFVGVNVMYFDNTKKMADTAGGRILIARPGTYLLESGCQMGSMVAGNTQMQLFKGGSSLVTAVMYPVNGNFGSMVNVVPAICAAGDPITIQVYTDCSAGGLVQAGLGSTFALALEQPSW